MTSCPPSSVRSRSSTPPAPACSHVLSAAPALTTFTAPPRRSPSPQSVPRRWRRARRPAVAKARRVRNGRGRAAWEVAWLLAPAGRQAGERVWGKRAPERRGGCRAGECRPGERAPEATQRVGDHRKGDPVRQPSGGWRPRVRWSDLNRMH
jgi:hypothetical protein